ncbi:MAG TPA: hypothetical protein VFH47_03045 [Candidatus Thermoplasmatota archaeon]|nr:hypothetical protein [Candidatus Thermoplasmatota archaeon]
MRAMLLLLTLSLLLAGCSSNAGVGADIKSRGSGLEPLLVPGAVQYQGCVEQDIAVAIPMADAQAMVPPGFTPLPWLAEAGLAAVLVWTTTCQSGEVRGDELRASGEMWAHIPVEPPQELRDASVDFYLVALGAYIADPKAAEAYNAWGFAPGWVSTGFVDIARTGRVGAVEASLAVAGDGNGTVRTTATAAGLRSIYPGGTGRVFIQDDDGLRGAFDTVYSSYEATTHAGHATLSFDMPSPLAPLPDDAYIGSGYAITGIAYSNRLVELKPADPAAAASSGTSARLALLGLA